MFEIEKFSYDTQDGEDYINALNEYAEKVGEADNSKASGTYIKVSLYDDGRMTREFGTENVELFIVLLSRLLSGELSQGIIDSLSDELRPVFDGWGGEQPPVVTPDKVITFDQENI